MMNAPRSRRILVAAMLCLAIAPVSFAKSKSRSKASKSEKSSAKASPAPKPSATPSKDWQVIKVGPRDYLSVDNIAKFYGLIGNVDSTGKSVVLNNGRNQLQVTLDSREGIVNGIRNWLCFPIIEKDGHYLMSRIDLAKTVEPQLRPQMIPNLGKFNTVVLDPGHGGHDKGACSSYGCEKDFVLDIARQLKPLLEAKGVKVITTRDSDVFIPLETRADIANRTPNCIFVSLHLNATDTNPSAAGFEIYSLTPRGAPSTQDNALALRFFAMQVGSAVDAPSLALSMSVYHSLLGHIPEFDRGIKRARFAVLRRTRVPAILVEGGFLTERGESKLIADSRWRAKYAQAISTGIENYKTLVDKRQRPMMLADYHRQLGGELIARDATKPPPESADTPSVVVANISQLAEPPPPTHTGSVGPANGEQEQEEDEPEHSAASAGTSPPPSIAAADTASVTIQSAPPVAEEIMPDTSPTAEPGSTPPTGESPAPTPTPAESPTQTPAVAKTNKPAAPSSVTSIIERFLRAIPPMPHFLP